jgi:pilus assembly protein CpaE
MKLPVVLIGEDNLALVSLRQQLEKERDYVVEGKIRGFEEAFGFLRVKSTPVLVVVDLSRDAERAFRVAQELKSKLPQVHIVMTSPDSHQQTILRAMRSGAEEFFVQPFNWGEVLQALEGMRRKIDLQHSRHAERGRIITVFSNKGGVGSTTVATNLGVSLAKRQKSVCRVDLVLQFGSVTTFLNLEPSYTILDLVKNIKRVDPLMLDGSLVKHSSGVRVLAEPFHAEDASTVGAGDIEQILDILVQSFQYVIVDTPKEFDDTGSVALDKAHRVLFVTEMDVPSLKSAHRALEMFERMGVYQRKIRLVLNRYIKSKIMTLESVEKTLGIKVFWTLPNDYPTAIAALNQGLAIQESDARSELARGYQGLAEAVMGPMVGGGSGEEEEDGKKQGLLSRWIPVSSGGPS